MRERDGWNTYDWKIRPTGLKIQQLAQKPLAWLEVAIMMCSTGEER